MKNISQYILEKANEKEMKALEDAFVKTWEDLDKGIYDKSGKGYDLKKFKERLEKEYDNTKPKGDIYSLWEDEESDWNQVLSLLMKHMDYENFDDMFRIYPEFAFIEAMKNTYPGK